MAVILGDALARAKNGACTPTGTLATVPRSVNNPYITHLSVSGWCLPAVTGSRKRITSPDADKQPLRHDSQRCGPTARSAPARPSVVLPLRTPLAVHLPYTGWTCTSVSDIGAVLLNPCRTAQSVQNRGIFLMAAARGTPMDHVRYRSYTVPNRTKPSV